MSYLSPAKPHILAHRGFARSGVDENTAAAFSAALALGATHIETDVRVTKDLVPVLFHDETLQRTMSDPRPVEEVTWEELTQLELANGGHVLSLDEALLVFADAKFNIDFKSVKSIAPSALVIRRMKAYDRVLVASFSQARIRRAVRLLKGRSIASAGSVRVVLLYLFALFGLPVGFLAKGLAAVQVPVAQAGLRFASKRFIRAMQKAGLAVHFWTINEPAEMERLVALGADGIVTDRTDLAVATLR